jgi:hypothetical protein
MSPLTNTFPVISSLLLWLSSVIVFVLHRFTCLLLSARARSVSYLHRPDIVGCVQRYPHFIAVLKLGYNVRPMLKRGEAMRADNARDDRVVRVRQPIAVWLFNPVRGCHETYSFISPWKMRLTGVVNEVAADKVTLEPVRGVHDGEAAGCRIDGEIAGLGDGADEAPC